MKIESPLLQNPHTQAMLRTALETRFGRPVDVGDVCDVSVQPLNYAALNPVSHGLERVCGAVSLGDTVQSFAFIRKAMGFEPLHAPHPSFETSNDSRHWNYWKREYYAYAETWLDNPETGLRLPAVYARSGNDDTAEVWIEALAGSTAVDWTVGEVARSAQHLGAWQGGFVQADFAKHAWLSRDWMRVLMTTRLKNEAECTADVDNWKSPLMRSLFEPELRDRVATLWAKRTLLLDAMDQLPHTLTHYDFRAPNLFRGDNGETIVIDWQFVGEGPFGQDLVSMTIDNTFMNFYPAVDLQSTEDAVFDAYFAGLESTGWRGSRDDVRFVYSATAGLRFGIACGWLVLLANDEAAAKQQEGMYGRSISELLLDRLAAVRHALTLGEEALARVE